MGEPAFQMQLSEAQFQAQVQDLASLNGWRWMHIRPGLNERGRYRTPVSGSLGAGWPDLVLVKGPRILFVELKAQAGQLTDSQKDVLYVLGGVAPVYVWRPRDWEDVLSVLTS